MPKSTIWDSQTVSEILQKAKTGKYSTRGFGTNRPLPSLDDLVIVPSQLAGSPAVDKYREHVDTEVVIGEWLEKPLRLKTPIFIAAMSFGAISKAGKMAFAYAASKVGTFTNTGEGGLLPEELEVCRSYGGSLVVQWSTGRFGVSAAYLKSGDAVEIKIGQGAKPGMGGHLLAEKVTPEIAKIRGIPMGTDALSPCRHLDVDSVEDLKKHVQLIRAVTENKVPVLIKLGPARVYDDARLAVELGADAIVIDGGEGGTGCAPHIVIEHAGIPTLGIMAPARRALKDTGAEKKGVKLLVMGGVRHGADVYKALALGADAVGIASAAMIAVGCTVCQMCDTGRCPKGIAGEGAGQTLDFKAAGEALANFINALTEEVKVLAALSGHSSISTIGLEDVRALTVDTSMITGAKLIGLEQPVTGLMVAGAPAYGAAADVAKSAAAV
ncbi:MAG: FMN-binding glutamate synthase family protein [Bacillota bacterium]